MSISCSTYSNWELEVGPDEGRKIVQQYWNKNYLIEITACKQSVAKYRYQRCVAPSLDDVKSSEFQDIVYRSAHYSVHQIAGVPNRRMSQSVIMLNVKGERRVYYEAEQYSSYSGITCGQVNAEGWDPHGFGVLRQLRFDSPQSIFSFNKINTSTRNRVISFLALNT